MKESVTRYAKQNGRLPVSLEFVSEDGKLVRLSGSVLRKHGKRLIEIFNEMILACECRDVLERISSGLTSRLEELDEEEEDADQSESPNC